MRIRISLAGLALLAGMSAAIATAQDKPVDKAKVADLTQKLHQAYEKKNWDAAIAFGLEVENLDPKNSENLYNLACVYCLKGDAASGKKFLAKAVDAGFSEVTTIEKDEDFASIRSDPAFTAAVARVKDNAKKTSGDFKAKAEKSEPLIIVPEGIDAGKPAPLIIALHPFGGTAEYIVERWKDVAKKFGAIIVAPRAVQPEGTGFQWGSPDQAEIIIAKAIEIAKSKHKIDSERVVLTGFSQGGYMTYIFGLKHAAMFRGLIPVAGRWDSDDSLIPKDVAKDKLPRVFIMVGDKDRTLEGNRAAAKALESAGFRVKPNEYQGVGHDFPTNRDEELTKALEFILK